MTHLMQRETQWATQRFVIAEPLRMREDIRRQPYIPTDCLSLILFACGFLTESLRNTLNGDGLVGPQESTESEILKELFKEATPQSGMWVSGTPSMTKIEREAARKRGRDFAPARPERWWHV